MPHSMLFVNGTIETGDEPATWAWVEDGLVRALGAGAPPGCDAPMIDLAGATLAPGFIDAHVHLSWLATALLGPDLSPCPDAGSVLDAVRTWRGPGRGARGEWIVGTGFDESPWRDQRLPTRDDLDRVERERPVLLQRVCGHIGIANSAALARTKPGPHTDLTTGRLAEDDLYVLNDQVRPGADELAAVLPDVFALLHRHGITAVHDVSAPEMVHALARQDRASAKRVRVTCAVPARYLTAAPRDAAPARDAAAFFATRGLSDLPLGGTNELFEVVGVKLFLDGSLGARTALLRAPYSDAATTRGTALYESPTLVELARDVDGAALQLMVHAIGDAALDQALGALEPVARDGNPRRHRLEHVEVTPPDLVQRLAQSGLWVCAQPNFAGRWSIPGGMNEQRLGARLQHCNAYRTLHAAGIPLAFGSDCMPLSPLYGLRSAVWHPLESERLLPGLALALYTGAAAHLTGSAARGTIGVGSVADLVVLAPRLEAAIAAATSQSNVARTFVAGRQVFGPNPGE